MTAARRLNPKPGILEPSLPGKNSGRLGVLTRAAPPPAIMKRHLWSSATGGIRFACVRSSGLFRETFRVDGRVKGKIVSEKTVIIGETAQVEADIDCGVVSIRGTVTGSIQGRERIELLAGSRVYGRLSSPRLVVEEGAFFQGECDMRGA